MVRAARERGLRVLGELELGWRLLPNDVIAITGSNGKTTTTELVGHDPPRGRDPRRGRGQRRHGADDARRHARPRAVVVCEASSFQLEDTVAFAPDAAVLLNLAPDHLDRHGTFAAYRAGEAARSSPTRPHGAVAVLPGGLEAGEPTAAARAARAASATRPATPSRPIAPATAVRGAASR